MTRTLLLLVMSSAVGCSDAEDRQRRSDLDALTKEREYLTIHQSNLRMAADAEIAGRPLDQLPPDAAARLAAYQMQYLAAERQLRTVDADLESLQKQPYTY